MPSLLFRIALLAVCILSTSHAANDITLKNTPIVGGPCEGCEAVFDGLPQTLRSQTNIAPPDEPGERLLIRGQVRHRDGKPAAGIIVYAYHTDNRGIYPPPAAPISDAADRHGRLRAWARTDEEGRYEFDTIRPAGYPQTDISAHVHLHVIEPKRCTYYIDNIVFNDDPRLRRFDSRKGDAFTADAEVMGDF